MFINVVKIQQLLQLKGIINYLKFKNNTFYFLAFKMLNSPNEYVLNGGGNPGLVEISKKINK